MSRRIQRSRPSRSAQIGHAAWGIVAGIVCLALAALVYLLAGHLTDGVHALEILGFVLMTLSSCRIFWVLSTANQLYWRYKSRRMQGSVHE